MQHQTVGAVGHDPQQLSGPAENQVAARGIEFSEQPLQKVAVQFDVLRQVQFYLEAALTVVAACAPTTTASWNLYGSDEIR